MPMLGRGRAPGAIGSTSPNAMKNDCRTLPDVFRPAVRRSPAGRHPVAERLEPRRLLSASLDPDTRILTITGTAGHDIIQFQVSEPLIGASAATSFSVLESTTTQSGPPLSFPTRQEILEHIESGGAPVVSSFALSLVNEIRIQGAAGNDLIILGTRLLMPVSMDGGDGNDSLSSGAGTDIVLGAGGNDYLFGGAGNDILNGQTESDELLGGSGLDTADFSNRLLGISATMDNVANDGVLEGDNLRADFEAIIGGQGNDFMDLSGSQAGLELDGGGGADTIIGSAFNDAIHGGAGANQLTGGGGDDHFFSENIETDTLDGGGGVDRALIDAQDDTPATLIDVEFAFEAGQAEGDLVPVAGGSAAIVNRVLRITGTSSADAVRLVLSADGEGVLVFETADFAAPGAQNFVREFALSGFDRIAVILGGGDDVFHGGLIAAPVDVDGGDGADMMAGGNANDLLRGGTGDDVLFGRDGHDTLRGGVGDDWLSGGAGNDTADYTERSGDVTASIGLFADDGERGERDNVRPDVNTLSGGAGNDRLSSVAGISVSFIGGRGRDRMTGGPGTDTYFAEDGEADTVRGGGNGD